MSRAIAPWTLGNMDFSSRPLFVCWEVTKACKLSCRHCRAKAIKNSLPGELDHKQGLALIEQILEFGEPYPALLFTGGDPLMRQDLSELIAYARDLGIYTAVAASATDLLDEEKLKEFKDLDVGVMSISIDGSRPELHDEIRGVPGTWARSLEILDEASKIGLKAQMNTTVLKSNLDQLADLFDIASKKKMAAWEVFFLVRTGRGVLLDNPDPVESEEVMQFLAIASSYGIPVRISEGAHFRRVLKQITDGMTPRGPLFENLRTRLEELQGEPSHPMMTRSTPTGDGKGVMFVAHNGEIHPSGFLPLNLGKFPEESMVDVYRDNQTFRDLRDDSRLKGKCHNCRYRKICGGSRSRAYAEHGDPLESDPLCLYESGIDYPNGTPIGNQIHQ